MESKNPRVYDCFTFFNELDLLELRFEELYDYVDFFVIAEANKTHSGKSKPFILEKNKARYKKYWKKVRYIKVADMPSFNWFDKPFLKIKSAGPGDIWRKLSAFGNGHGRWKLEHHQRNAIIRGLKDARDEDIIMVSDLDEIINHKKIKEMNRLLEKEKIVKFDMKLYYYYLNGLSNVPWDAAKACKYKFLRDSLKNKPHFLRELKDYWKGRFGLLPKPFLIKDGGWHFSYLGGIDKVKEKITATSHVEFINSGKMEDVEKKIRGGEFLDNIKIRYISMDSSFPKFITSNRKKWSEYIMKV